MTTIPKVTRESSFIPEMPKKEAIQVEIAKEAMPPEAIVKLASSIDGPVEVICWFEGPIYLPREGAKWMKEKILEPLATSENVTVNLYSLNGSWNFKKPVQQMPSSTPIGDAINKLKKPNLRCLYGADFFRFCAGVSQDSDLYALINGELPKKQWLFDLSKDRPKMMKISKLFDDRSSLFNCIQDKDASEAYSAMQFYEGYYLIRELVQKALAQGKTECTVLFLLPYDEGKYYRDLPQDLKKLLLAEFDSRLEGFNLDVRFYFFPYGPSKENRPYLSRTQAGIKPYQIPTFFNYLG